MPARACAASACTHSPRSVSIPTVTWPGSSSLPRCAAISSCSRAIPAAPSGSRLAASLRPASSWISTSWCSSDQSSPTNSNVSFLLASITTVRLVSSLRENGSRPNGSVLTPHRARQPNSGHLSRSLAGARSNHRTHVLLGVYGAHPPAAAGPSLHPHETHAPHGAGVLCGTDPATCGVPELVQSI